MKFMENCQANLISFFDEIKSLVNKGNYAFYINTFCGISPKTAMLCLAQCNSNKACIKWNKAWLTHTCQIVVNVEA